MMLYVYVYYTKVRRYFRTSFRTKVLPGVLKLHYVYTCTVQRTSVLPEVSEVNNIFGCLSTTLYVQ